MLRYSVPSGFVILVGVVVVAVLVGDGRRCMFEYEKLLNVYTFIYSSTYCWFAVYT